MPALSPDMFADKYVTCTEVSGEEQRHTEIFHENYSDLRTPYKKTPDELTLQAPHCLRVIAAQHSLELALPLPPKWLTCFTEICSAFGGFETTATDE